MDTSSKKISSTMSTVENTTTSIDKSDNVEVMNIRKCEPTTKGITSNKETPVHNENGNFITRPRIISVAPNGAFWANDGYDDYYFDENGDEC